MAGPLEHDVVLIEHDGHYAVRRAVGVGVNTRHHAGAPVTVALRAEAIAIGEHLATENSVDLWIVEGERATLISPHRASRSR